MSGRERRKGVSGEREVVEIFRAFPFGEHAERAGFGTFQLSGDVVGLSGLVVAVKRHEVLRIPAWIREADALAEGREVVPVLAYRTSARGVAPEWRADLPLRDFARIYDEACRAQLEAVIG